MVVASILKIPLVRHFISSAIVLAIGFFLGWKIFDKKLDSAKEESNLLKGKYEELQRSYEHQKVVLDTLQSNILRLANKESIKIDNHVDAKLKKGGKLNFSPETIISDTIPKKRRRGLFRRKRRKIPP
ncbi:hypothetical protein ACFSTE_10950 [Aquimarina hainanensis]|uniref:Uncharacterized protein n=1 Tax=Aquimarina hainanensis TaxID=1578017 RepID=A0ABW5N7U8_9FLAO